MNLGLGLGLGERKRVQGGGSPPPPPTPWTPLDLGSTLLAWYEGDELTGADAAAITNWPDTSGNANHATNASGQATKRTNVLNSMPVARFPGFSTANSFLNVPNIYSGKSAASAFCLLKLDADPPAISEQTGLWTFGSSGTNDAFPHTTGSVFDGFCSTARKSYGNPTPSLASAFRICSWHSAASDHRIYIDGVLFDSTVTNTFGATATPVIGYSNNSATTTYDGDMAEIILTDTVLSQANREKVEGYLAHKWFGAGASNNLDSGHPYKNDPPLV